jgi:5-methylcytosine-specific restriction endonuclease McrA
MTPAEHARKLATQKRWRDAHPGAAAAATRAWRAKAENANWDKAWRDANPDKVATHNKTWSRKNPEKKLAYNRARYARLANAPGTATSEQIQARVQMFGGLCWMCGKTANSIDHVIPVSRGGFHWPANLRPSCKSCNSRKFNRSWREFKRVV